MFDYSGVGCSGDGLLGASRCTLRVHAGFADSSTDLCARRCVHLQDNFPDRGF